MQEQSPKVARVTNERGVPALAGATKPPTGAMKFRRQHPIDRYIVDFASLDGKLIIEVDGLTHATSAALRRDEERTRVLESLGFLVVRVSNTDVYDNLDGVLEMIDRTLRPQ